MGIFDSFFKDTSKYEGERETKTERLDKEVSEWKKIISDDIAQIGSRFDIVEQRTKAVEDLLEEIQTIIDKHTFPIQYNFCTICVVRIVEGQCYRWRIRVSANTPYKRSIRDDVMCQFKEIPNETDNPLDVGYAYAEGETMTRRVKSCTAISFDEDPDFVSYNLTT